MLDRLPLPEWLRWNRPYPDLTTSPIVPFEEVDVLVELDFPPGNVTSSLGGRVFFGYHPFAQPWRFADGTVFELEDGEPASRQPDHFASTGSPNPRRSSRIVGELQNGPGAAGARRDQ